MKHLKQSSPHTKFIRSLHNLEYNINGILMYFIKNATDLQLFGTLDISYCVLMYIYIYIYYIYACICVCVCACVRACVRVCMCV